MSNLINTQNCYLQLNAQEPFCQVFFAGILNFTIEPIYAQVICWGKVGLPIYGCEFCRNDFYTSLEQ
jgi:hypothetical protein